MLLIAARFTPMAALSRDPVLGVTVANAIRFAGAAPTEPQEILVSIATRKRSRAAEWLLPNLGRCKRRITDIRRTSIFEA